MQIRDPPAKFRAKDSGRSRRAREGPGRSMEEDEKEAGPEAGFKAEKEKEEEKELSFERESPFPLKNGPPGIYTGGPAFMILRVRIKSSYIQA